MKLWQTLLLFSISSHSIAEVKSESGICFINKQAQIEQFYRNGKCPIKTSNRVAKGFGSSSKGIEIKSDRIGVLFDFNKTELKPAFFDLLAEWGGALQNLKNMRFSIQGHTDYIGTDSDNLTLSKQRAQQVKQHLVSHYAIQASRLEIRGFGEQNPLRGNHDWQSDGDRLWNRRVEFVLLK